MIDNFSKEEGMLLKYKANISYTITTNPSS